MSSRVEFKVIRSQGKSGKSLVVTAVAATLMSLFAGCESTNVSSVRVSPPTSIEIETLSEKIEQSVKRLGYSEDIARDFADMAISWKDQDQQPVLVVWEKKFNKVKEDRQLGRIPVNRVAKIEEGITRELGLMIKKTFSTGPDKLFSLSDVIKQKQAQCLSYSQLFYILGDSIGLEMQTLRVIKLRTNQLSEGHVACITNLIDGRMMMVDLAGNPTPMISEPFVLQKEFKRAGDCWELKNEANPVRLHKIIRIYNDNVLFFLSGINTMEGNVCYYAGQSDKAVSMFTNAIEFCQIDAPFLNRGIIYRVSGRNAESVSDFNNAIEINPWAAKSYANRAMAYIELGKTDQGKKDLLKVLELEPNRKESVREISEKYELNLKLD